MSAVTEHYLNIQPVGRDVSYQNVVCPSFSCSLQRRLPQLHHMVESGRGPVLWTPLICVGPGAGIQKSLLQAKEI